MILALGSEVVFKVYELFASRLCSGGGPVEAWKSIVMTFLAKEPVARDIAKHFRGISLLSATLK
eukprot:4251478-Pyramimonas_sp.AAC.1